MLIAFSSCQKNVVEKIDDVDEDSVKLLPVTLSVSGSGWWSVDSLVYDDQNRVMEYWMKDQQYDSKTVYTYKNGMPETMEYYDTFPGGMLTEKYVYSDKINNVVTETHTYYDNYADQYRTSTSSYLYNSNNQLIKQTFEDGTVIEEITWDSIGRASYIKSLDFTYFDNTFKYDNYKGAFSAVKSLFAFDVVESNYAFTFIVNNPLEQVYTYTDDNSGDLITQKTTYSYTYNDQGYPITYTQSDGGRTETDTIKYIQAK